MATLTADQLLEAFESMTVLELSEFKKKFEDKFGVTAAAPIAVAAAPAAGAAAAGAAAAGPAAITTPPDAASRPCSSLR